jgi:hypothetical protein
MTLHGAMLVEYAQTASEHAVQVASRCSQVVLSPVTCAQLFAELCAQTFVPSNCASSL